MENYQAQKKDLKGLKGVGYKLWKLHKDIQQVLRRSGK